MKNVKKEKRGENIKCNKRILAVYFMTYGTPTVGLMRGGGGVKELQKIYKITVGKEKKGENISCESPNIVRGKNVILWCLANN